MYTVMRDRAVSADSQSAATADERKNLCEAASVGALQLQLLLPGRYQKRKAC